MASLALRDNNNTIVLMCLLCVQRSSIYIASTRIHHQKICSTAVLRGKLLTVVQLRARHLRSCVAQGACRIRKHPYMSTINRWRRRQSVSWHNCRVPGYIMIFFQSSCVYKISDRSSNGVFSQVLPLGADPGSLDCR